MSPPGISLSYAADDEGTALDEMQDPATYALAEFEILKPAPVLDLTRVPPGTSAPNLSVTAREKRDQHAVLLRRKGHGSE